jgi:hypothetical protein
MVPERLSSSSTTAELSITSVATNTHSRQTMPALRFTAKPSKEKVFTDEKAVRENYYAEVESILKRRLPGVKKVVIFDHTIRRRLKDAPRQPVQQVHVDQTPGAAEVPVRRHLPVEEAEELLKGRYQIINIWRPIENPASDFRLAVIDWRTTDPADFKAVDLLYPKRNACNAHDDDDRGKEKLPDPNAYMSTRATKSKAKHSTSPRTRSPSFITRKTCYRTRSCCLSASIREEKG